MYSLKTASSSWIEDVGGSAMYKRGFTTASYETESQHQQIGMTGKPEDEYGAALPVKYLVERTTADSIHPTSGPPPTTWQTQTQSMLSNAWAKPVRGCLFADRIFRTLPLGARWIKRPLSGPRTRKKSRPKSTGRSGRPTPRYHDQCDFRPSHDEPAIAPFQSTRESKR